MNQFDETAELKGRVESLEKERDAARNRAALLEKKGAVADSMASFTWRNEKQRDLLAREYIERIEQADDGVFVISGERAHGYIERDIAANHQNLLADTREGKVSTSKKIDYNNLSPKSSPDDFKAAGRQAAKDLTDLMR